MRVISAGGEWSGCRSSALEGSWFFLVEERGDLNAGVFASSWEVQALASSAPRVSVAMGRSPLS